MSAFWIVILIGVAIFIYSQFERNNNLSVYDNNRSVIEAWINSKDGKIETLLANLEIGSFETRDAQEVAGYADVMGTIFAA